jgi:predicted HicB family RNase H-like nuclease
MPASEARMRANRKYNEKAYDRIELKVTKGKKADLQAHAERKGESLNGFVNRAIDEAVERDGGGVE